MVFYAGCLVKRRIKIFSPFVMRLNFKKSVREGLKPSDAARNFSTIIRNPILHISYG